MGTLVATALLMTLAALSLVPVAAAQGCALCKTAVEAAGPEAGGVMNLAILILLVPTLSIFVGILLWAFRHRGLG